MSRAGGDKELQLLRDLMKGPDIGLPKYVRLRNSLAGAISDGAWKAGEKVPTEDRITQATGLSLGTVQRALRALTDEGLVVRRHGSGTFVAEGAAPMDEPFHHCRFVDDEGRLLPIFSKFARRHRVKEPGAWSRHLRGADIWCLERTFSIDGEFSIYTHLYFDAGRLPALAEAPATRLAGVNLKTFIAAEYRIALTHFAETMRVAVFPAYVCEAIRVKRGTSGAVLEVVARDRQGAAVYFQDLHVPPAGRRLVISG